LGVRQLKRSYFFGAFFDTSFYFDSHA